MADGIPAVIMGACVFAHDRVDVFVRQFGWYRRSNRLLSHDALASWDESLFYCVYDARLKARFQSNLEEKPRPSDTFFLPLYKKTGTRPAFL